jgi:hypothetical protein
MQQPQAGTPGQRPGNPGQQPGTPGQQLGYPGMPPGYPGSPKNPMSEAVYLSQPGTQPGAFAAPRRTCAWHALSTSCRPAYLRVGCLLLAAAACATTHWPEMPSRCDLTRTGLLRVRRSSAGHADGTRRSSAGHADGWPSDPDHDWARRDPDWVGGRMAAICPALHPVRNGAVCRCPSAVAAAFAAFAAAVAICCRRPLCAGPPRQGRGFLQYNVMCGFVGAAGGLT